MKPFSLLLYSLLILLSCTSCTKDKPAILGVASFRLTPQEVAKLEELAKTETDGKAAYRLHEYHAFYEADPVTGRIWLAKAAQQGHADAMDTLKHLEQTNGSRK
jgi:TPR repeat protein